MRQAIARTPRKNPPGQIFGIRSPRRRLPTTRVIVLGILPVKNEAKWVKCKETNRILAGYAYPKDEVVFLDLQDLFIDADDQLKPGLFTDGTHLTTRGYEVLADAIQPEIDRLIEAGPIR